jgi:hypothetical protein
VKGAHWKMLCQFAERNDTPDSIKQSFRKLKKERQLQAEDARRERALAKEAKAAQRKEDREAEASAKELCRKLAANLPRPRSKAVVRSEAELRALGGEKVVISLDESRRQTRWIFGLEGQTRFIHTPEDGLWRLDAKPGALEEDLKRVLNQAGRNLRNVPEPEDKQREGMDIAVKAVDALLYWSQNWQDFRHQEHARIYAQFAILTTLQALERDLKNNSHKLKLAYEMRTGVGTPSKNDKLYGHAAALAVELQRPPTKKELKDRFDSKLQHPFDPSEFSKRLKETGLSWLKRGQRAPSR